MLKFSGFHFKKPVLLSVAILGLAMIAIDASAQTENGKFEEIIPKTTSDRVGMEGHTLIQENPSSTTLGPKFNTSQKPTASNSKKDLTAGESVSEKEVKRNESPSTLSFNIFLYIVDKFKAD